MVWWWVVWRVIFVSNTTLDVISLGYVEVVFEIVTTEEFDPLIIA